ncbi:unnamed protein product [Polarella glacialis]|uniref:Uncharacterized protein n=1 Tax=Polarella glacialis TaxID=89957 RepID=A0A813JIU9_POLGL|nr:unnamed protein product [Polarella glacialis]
MGSCEPKSAPTASIIDACGKTPQRARGSPRRRRRSNAMDVDAGEAKPALTLEGLALPIARRQLPEADAFPATRSDLFEAAPPQQTDPVLSADGCPALRSPGRTPAKNGEAAEQQQQQQQQQQAPVAAAAVQTTAGTNARSCRGRNGTPHARPTPLKAVQAKMREGQSNGPPAATGDRRHASLPAQEPKVSEPQRDPGLEVALMQPTLLQHRLKRLRLEPQDGMVLDSNWEVQGQVGNKRDPHSNNDNNNNNKNNQFHLAARSLSSVSTMPSPASNPSKKL